MLALTQGARKHTILRGAAFVPLAKPPCNIPDDGVVWDRAAASADLSIGRLLVVLTRTSANAGTYATARAALSKTEGYFEATITVAGNAVIGLDTGTVALNDFAGDTGTSVGYQSTGSVLNNGGSVATYATYTLGDVISVYFKNGKTYFAKNGTWQGGADPVAETGGITPASAMTSAKPIASLIAVGAEYTANFGNQTFVYSVPSGGLAWNAYPAGSASAAVGIGTEADVSFALGMASPAGLASGTNTAFALSAAAVTATGLATETDSSQTLAGKIVRVVGLGSETDSGLALSAKAILAAGLGSEADSAQTLTGKIIRALGLATETDGALAFGRAVTSGLAAETDASLARTGVAILAAGRSDETDTALQLLQGGLVGSVGVALETDLSRALGRAVGLGISLETDASIGRGAGLTLGRASETDSSLSLSMAVARGVGLANETDAAQARGYSAARAAGAANENDTAVAVGVALRVGIAVSTNDALPLAFVLPAPVPASRTILIGKSRAVVGIQPQRRMVSARGARWRG